MTDLEKRPVAAAVAAAAKPAPAPAVAGSATGPQLPVGKPRHTDVYVSFTSEISPTATESLLALMAQQANNGVKRVHLLISTPGGSVMHGMTLYNVLRALPFELITYNVGNVDSIGNAVFLAGAQRYACPHSTFMFHGVGIQPQTTRYEEKRLKEHLQGILADTARIGSVIADRTTLSKDEIVPLFSEAQTKDADWARAHGIIHDIREVKIPDGTPILQLVFQRQAAAR